MLGLGGADHARVSADFNWAAPSAAQGHSWARRAAFRLNALLQDTGVMGRDHVSLESRAIAPSVALGLGTPTRVTVGTQFVQQDNLPDYGLPGAAWAEWPLTPTTVQANAPVRQSNYYGSPGYDYDHAEQSTYSARIEHDVNRNLTLRNHTRYNRTHREAVISTVQSVASFNPETSLVTVARQGNDRENTVLSNQTTLVDRFSTGRLRHGVSLGLDIALEEQFAPGLGGVGTRAPVDIFTPNPNDPISGYAPARTAAETLGATDTVALYAFDTVELSQRVQVSGGLRWEHFETSFHSRDASGVTTADLRGADGLLSGKASVLFRASEAGNLYFSYGTTVTPPGSTNFTLSAQANNQNNPNVEPQESANLEVGTKWDLAAGRLSLTGAAFRTTNENVIYTVDATAVPPLYNQDDAQLVKGVTAGAMGRITDRWEVLANVGYLDSENRSQNPALNGKRLTLTPSFSGSVWTTYRLPRGVTLGGGLRHTDAVYVNAANTIRVPGYQVADALVEYAVNTHLSLRMNVYNLTDAVFVRNVNNNGGRYNPGNPRSAVVTSRISF
jgi:catecholate siderophore receptor